MAVRVILPPLFSRDFSCAPFSEAAAFFNNLGLVNSCCCSFLFFCRNSTGLNRIFHVPVTTKVLKVLPALFSRYFSVAPFSAAAHFKNLELEKAPFFQNSTQEFHGL